MSTPSVSLCQAVPLASSTGADGGVPAWIHLLPTGTVRTQDGRGPYRVPNPAEIAAQSIAAGPLPLDENHATDLAAPQGQPAPARGWITALEARADGIWGQVEWTDEGRQLVEGRAYRHISPVIAHTADGTVTGVLRASLVNRPNLKGLTSLNQETSMDLAALRAALGLPADASEADILAAATRARGAVALQGEIAGAIGLQAASDGTAVLAAVKARVDPTKSVPIAQVEALRTELVALQGQVTAAQQATARREAEVFVDAAIARGVVGVKPLRDHYITRHMAKPEDVVKEIGALPTLSGAAIVPAAAGSPKTSKVSPDAPASEIQAAATLHQEEAKKAGVTLSFVEAVRAVTAT